MQQALHTATHVQPRKTDGSDRPFPPARSNSPPARAFSYLSIPSIAAARCWNDSCHCFRMEQPSSSRRAGATALMKKLVRLEHYLDFARKVSEGEI
jgi:hypothetical protein